MAFTTHNSLIARVIQGDEISWSAFESEYKPLIIIRGKDRGLQHKELDDLVQETLLSFFKSKDRFVFDKSKGRFRNYLKTIIDRRAFDIIRKRNDNADIDVLKETLQSKDSEELDKSWETSWRQYLLHQATEIVKVHVTEEAYEIFQLAVIEGYDAKYVASVKSISVDAVYLQKHRTLKRVQQIIKQLSDEEDK